MEDPKQPEDDGHTHIKRLSPEQFDVVLGAHPSKRKAERAPTSGSFGRNVIVIAALGIGAYALIGMFHTSKPAEKVSISQPVSVQSQVKVAESAPPAPVAKPVAAVPPSFAVDEPAPTSEPSQRASSSSGFQSMVSPSYMADYKADLQHNSTSKRQVRVDIATATIREWDGRNRYRAQWKIYNNHIEDDSVCFNFPSASIEHRECRKAAQVYFKEQCREWSKRADEDREEQSKATEQRYCGAAGSFNPAG